MGISTIPSYCGAQIFEAVGLAPELVDRHFTGTPSRIGGIGLDVLAREALDRHARAYPGERGRAAAGRRPLRLAPRRRAPPVEPGDDRAAPARRARTAAARPTRSTRRLVNDDSARRSTLRGLLRFRFAEDGGIPLDEVEPAEGDRQALLDRRDVARLALARGARDARDRDEPDRRPVEHRRGRGGPGALRPATRTATRAARRSSRSPRAASASTSHYLVERRRAADQDGAGREARRGRPAARPQGRPVHRERPADDAGRRADLAAAAPRHLLDRGSQAADLRPALREPRGAHLGEARRRGRRRHRRRRRREGERRPRPDLRARRRHRRVAALVDPVRRHPVGDRPRRDAADARAQRPALADLGADRRPAQDRPRRRRSPRCSAPTRWASRPRR